MITAPSHRSAFTLIEMIIYVAIFSIVVVSFVGILVATLNVQTSQSAANEVNTQSQYLLQQIQYYISSARLVDMAQDTATSTLFLRGYYSALDPTTITLSSGTVNLQQGYGLLQPLTSNKVFVSQLSFTRHFQLSTSSAYGTDSVTYSFTMTATSTNNKSYSQAFQSSAAVFVPVPKIALLQKAKAELFTAASSNIITYPTNNETSSLLIAFINVISPTSTISISDSAGNTWNIITSNTYPYYGTKMSIFAALNARNSSNTVTAALGAAVSSSFFLFEYRGASTSSSFDASSSQIQNGTTPSTGLANPTSTAELLFAGATNYLFSEVPSAGTGFIMEATSVGWNGFVEDANQYITGPVGATWSYLANSSTSAVIATFK